MLENHTLLLPQLIPLFIYSALVFPDNVPRLFILSQPDKLRMS